MRTFLPAQALATAVAVLWCGTAAAQFWPGVYGNPYYGYGGWGGGYSNTTRNIASENQLQGQTFAAAQNARMQSNIRGTMTSQAQARSQAILDERQSNRDWWFQVQQQQNAQRPPPSYRGSAAAGQVASLEPAPAARVVRDDVMKWPAVLGDARFDADRAAIEAPYRRTPGKLSVPTAAEYQAMLKTIERMKATLKDMTAEITAREYLDAEAFLNLIATQATERAEKATAKD